MTPSKPSSSSGSTEPVKREPVVRRTVYRYHQDLVREQLGEGKLFRMKSAGTYVMHPSGAFVRTDKDRRSVKERKRAKREAREKAAAA